jgi:transposase
VLKQDIDIAPVHHRLPERIRAHALICFLALVLHRILRSRMRTTGSPLSPTRALALLRQVQHIDLSINQQPAARTSTITPEQRDLFALMKLPAPTKNARL